MSPLHYELRTEIDSFTLCYVSSTVFGGQHVASSIWCDVHR